LYTRFMAAVRPEPDSRTTLPETMRACSVLDFSVRPVIT
jgi:hypothetical protein